MWKLLFLFHLQFAFGGCQFIRTPLNTAVIVGQRLELVCQPNSNFTIREWKIQRLEGISSPIYGNWRNSRFEDKRFGFEIDNDSSVVIYLNSTELDDAGIYSCHIHAGTQQPRQHNAQVVVFETEPVCEDVMSTAYNDTLEEGNIVWMRCSLNFRGNLAPTMEWRQHGGSGEIDRYGRVVTEAVETTIIPDGNISMISSTLSIVINSTYNATYFTCKTYFEWNNASIQNSAATNAPDCSYTWNSSSIILPATTFIQKEPTTVSASASLITSTKNGLASTSTTSSPFNAIYLVAGIAVLFGVASSLVAIILCLRLTRKKSAAMAMINPAEPREGDYDLIPYAITDGYDTIEEVNENDDNLFHNFPARHGPLPSPGYSGLMPDEPKPPGVYSRMDHQEKSVDEKSDVELQSIIDRSQSDYLKVSDAEESDMKRTMPGNNYLDLETEFAEDEEIPSAYLKITDDSLQSNLDNTAIKANQKDANKKPTPRLNTYIEVVTNSDDSDEIPSAYLRITDEDMLSSRPTNDVFEANQGEKIPSSYVNTREIKS